MTAWWSGSARAFLEITDQRLLETLAASAVRRFRINEVQQLRAWEAQLPMLRETLQRLPDNRHWHVLLEFEIPRLGGRIDVVLLSPRAVFVIEFKVGADRFDVADQLQLEGYALDLQDFHAASRRHPILPILVATEAATPSATLPFLLPGRAALLLANKSSLADLVRSLDRLVPAVGHVIDPAGWEHAAYQPVPNVIEAACLLYDRNDVADIATARADAVNLTLTTGRIAAILAQARASQTKAILFVTGIPGAGKTLCGLNVAFPGSTVRLTLCS